jgi:hypothetical protein
MKTYKVVDVQLQEFLKPAVDKGDWSASCSSYFTPENRIADFHCTRSLKILDAVGGRKKKSPSLLGIESLSCSSSQFISLTWFIQLMLML